MSSGFEVVHNKMSFILVAVREENSVCRCFNLRMRFLLNWAYRSQSSYQGAGKRPRQCCHPKGGNGAEGPKGPRTKGTVTRGPEGPESGQNMRVRGPEGPEDEQS